MKNKWVERRVNVCDGIVRNWLNEMGFTYRKGQMKTDTNTQIEENEIQV